MKCRVNNTIWSDLNGTFTVNESVFSLFPQTITAVIVLFVSVLTEEKKNPSCHFHRTD